MLLILVLRHGLIFPILGHVLSSGLQVQRPRVFGADAKSREQLFEVFAAA